MYDIVIIKAQKFDFEDALISPDVKGYRAEINRQFNSNGKGGIRNFSGQVRFLRMRSFLEFFLINALKIEFQMRHLTHRWTQSGYFFLKSGQFRLILKKGQARPRSGSLIYQ